MIRNRADVISIVIFVLGIIYLIVYTLFPRAVPNYLYIPLILIGSIGILFAIIRSFFPKKVKWFKYKGAGSIDKVSFYMGIVLSAILSAIIFKILYL